MSLKPDASILGALAVVAMVYGIHEEFTPTMADMKGLPAGNTDVDGSERKATWVSAIAVSGISLLAKDPTIFVFGAVATIAMAVFTRHAVWTEPASGASTMAPAPGQLPDDLNNGPAAVGDTTPYTMFAGQNNEFM